MKQSAAFLTLIFLALLSVGCNPINPPTGTIQLGPQSWIDMPLDGSVLPPNPVMEVVSHSADPLGIVQVELSVNGAVVKTDLNTDTTQTLVTMKQPWQPLAPGNYTLMVRAQNSAGVWGDYAQAVVTIRGPAAGGSVQGVVYADLNGNGKEDPGEGPLDGVTVSISGCGPAAAQTTAADGKFSFSKLPAGSCLVEVSKPGWAFTGTFPPGIGYPAKAASDPAKPTAFSIFMTPRGTPSPSPATSTPTRLTATPTPLLPVRTPTRTVVPPTRTFTPIPPTGTAPPLGCAGTPIISSFSASPSTIPAGGSATLSWGPVTNADAVEIDQGIGGVGTPGSVVVSPGVTTVYTLTARCKGVTTTARTVVTVLPAPTPTPTLFIPPFLFVTPTNTPVGVR